MVKSDAVQCHIESLSTIRDSFVSENHYFGTGKKKFGRILQLDISGGLQGSCHHGECLRKEQNGIGKSASYFAWEFLH